MNKFDIVKRSIEKRLSILNSKIDVYNEFIDDNVDKDYLSGAVSGMRDEKFTLEHLLRIMNL